MSTQTSQAASGGVSTLGLLGVAFIVLKLCGVIGWSWWWVLAPFWVPGAILVLVAMIAVLIYGLVR